MLKKQNLLFLFVNFTFLLFLFNPLKILPQRFNSTNGEKIRQTFWKGQQISYYDNQLLIKKRETTNSKDIENFLQQYNGKITKGFDNLDWAKIEFPGNVDVFELINILLKSNLIKVAEPKIIDHIDFTPNDSSFSEGKQWALQNTGQSPPGGTSDADIDAPEAWNISQGDESILIAVIDSGIPIDTLDWTLSHPDLDDPDKFILGPDYSNDSSWLPHWTQFENVLDLNGHGSHVTGIISAETNNNNGIAGVASKCKVLVIQGFNWLGQGSSEAFYSGVLYAVDYANSVGANLIINYSGSGSASSIKEDAVEYARDNDVLICCSVGNNGTDTIKFPAAYSSLYNNVIAIGATDHNDGHSSYSNYGSELIVSAPGGYGDAINQDDIYSTTPDYPFYLYGLTHGEIEKKYGYMAGTSQATAHTSGLSALILSINPELSPVQIRNIIQQTSEDKGTAGFDNYYGYGRIDAYDALKYTIENYGGTFNQDVILPSSDTWSIQEGVNLTFENGYKLIVNGTLEVNGTSGSPVVFNRSGVSGTWGGIQFNSGSSGSLE